MKVYEAMARAFAAEQTGFLFSLMGDANMYWMASLLDLGVTTNVHARHENAAVAMADGYARAAGQVGVATVTSGPGLAHAAAAVIGAVRYEVPMVIFAGDTVPGDASALQYLDHHAFAAMCGIHCEPVVSGAGALPAVQSAFRRARLMRQPVLLSVPMDIQEKLLPGPYEYRPSFEIDGAHSRTVPDPDSLDSAAGLVASSRRPIILLGHGALETATLTAVERLGDRIGALYATTLRAKGAMGGSPWDLGVAGTFSRPQTEQVFGEADLVIGVGASLNRFTRQEGHLFSQARTIQIVDRPAPAVPQAMPVTTHLQGDAGLTLEALCAFLEEAELTSPGFRERFSLAPWDPFAEGGTVGPDEEAMDPRRLVQLLDEAIPDDALIVCGAGHFWSFVNKGLSGRGDRRFMYCLGFGSIGQALPVSIGAALGSAVRPVVVIDGDTSILMYIAELDTAARHRLKLLAVIMDDDAMGAELHKLRLKGATDEAAIVPSPDLALVSQGFGVPGKLIRSADELEKALDDFDWASQLLLDVKISRSVVDVAAVMGNEVAPEVQHP